MASGVSYPFTALVPMHRFRSRAHVEHDGQHPVFALSKHVRCGLMADA